MSTIRDVAKLANVSTATVSRVINHDTKYKLTDATKERVWDAIRELNYSLPAKIPNAGRRHPLRPCSTKSAASSA